MQHGRRRNEVHREHVVVSEKRCYKCQQTKPAAHFYVDTRKKDGLQGRCKDCQRLDNKQFVSSQPEVTKRKRHIRYLKEKHLNPLRYAIHRDKYLQRAADYRATAIGRMRSLLHSALTRSSKKGFAFEIDIDWLMEKFDQQKGRCLLTGIEFSMFKKADNKRHYGPTTPSLDRIDPKEGYTKENTRLVCTAINIAMNHFGEDFFKSMCKAYLEKNT